MIVVHAQKGPLLGGVGSEMTQPTETCPTRRPQHADVRWMLQTFSSQQICAGMEGDLKPAEKRLGWCGRRGTCLAPSLQTSLRTSCATAGLVTQTVSGNPGLQTRLGVGRGLKMKKSPRRPHGRTAVLAGLIPFSFHRRPWSHLLQKSLAVVHDQAKQMVRQREPAHQHPETSALAEASLVAGSKSLPCYERSSVRWPELDHPQTHQRNALLQEWSDLPKMKACVHTFVASLHGNKGTLQQLKS